MRFYAFTNYYLSPMAQGIQCQHCTADMFVKYFNLKDQNWTDFDPCWSTLITWADDHKTTIILNGGNQNDLVALYQEIEALATELFLPCQYFREDEQSLNNAMTCVGVVVPQKIYELAAFIREERPSITIVDGKVKIMYGHPQHDICMYYTDEVSEAELALAQILNRYGLAR